MPAEDIIYFGDTARVPYGIKSEKVIRQYTAEITRFLLSHKVKMILIACNTVSATAEEVVSELASGIPVLNVISAGTEAVGRSSTHSHVGVIGTLATITSEAYVQSLQRSYDRLKVTQQACPLLVPLAEEGWTDNEIARKTLEEYLSVFAYPKPDALILGCTHYPLFKNSISEILGKDTTIIDSAESIASQAREWLVNANTLNHKGGGFKCYVSDRPQRFKELAERFLGQSLVDPELVTL